MNVLGLDLSTTRCRAATLDEQGKPKLIVNEHGSFGTEADIFFLENGEVLIGSVAANAGAAEPQRHVRDEKRFVGTDHVLFQHPDTGAEYRAVDLQALRIEVVKRDFERATGETPIEIVIAVPANYRDPQIESVRRSCEIAGLDLVGTAKEPMAAAFGNGLHTHADGLAAVFDLGGGTFDFSILEVVGNSVRTVITRGVPHLGGRDFSDRLRVMVLERFEANHGFVPDPQEHAVALFELDQRVETAKFDLTLRDQTQLVWSCAGHVVTMKIASADFDAAVRDLVEDALDCVGEALNEKALNPVDVGEFLMVGGGSKPRCVAEALKQRFGFTPGFQVDPFYAVALGTAEIARIERDERRVPVTVGRQVLPMSRHTFQETTPFPFGVAVVDDEHSLINSVVLTEGLPIPSDHTERYTLERPGQTGACVRILQGRNGVPAAECVELGIIELDGLPAIHDGPHRIEVRFTIDKLGTLRAEAVDPHCGKRGVMVMSYEVAKESA